ncbi:MAG: hypothetical protein B6D77_06765 [gamma proteobacterium symbiont of Ctena orbiculata]|nr:MAG: hypothetical protein B6D77_06765 [gamma proteobacterium symbiont of Ctena orbiculata]PVV21625.1 MAG: hypothetical protein B6D78_07380 [gamma proteobacterium symbiont of Ctena orbiculata]
MEDILTSVSILVVLFTFIFGYLERRASDRRKRTLEFLLKVIESDGPIHEAHLKFAAWAAASRVFEDDQVTAEDDEVIIRLLDYYDLIADTAKKKVIDKEMVILHLGGRMRSTYSVLSNYVIHRRKRLRREGLYKVLEVFIIKDVANKNV